ncbi:unnamed protein product [Leptidea sinapis]|uniref:Uncharacterized protein n=1 Tax=Leptidea sinapis TaxID=189913 RepID=A0A5E4QYL9_9NEOP|nr:unnamed protein product [Leptidea sinapis]
MCLRNAPVIPLVLQEILLEDNALLRKVLSSQIPQCLKTKVFNQRLIIAQRAMERAMLGVSLRD